MPIIINSSFKPYKHLQNKHLQTVFPSIFRKVELNYTREILETNDKDIIELDWSRVENTSRLTIVLHGLEGKADRHYMKGMAKAINTKNTDVLAINYRGCDKPNKLAKAYHSGKTEDIDRVLLHVIKQKKYKEISLLGFSIGGNIVLKYIGEKDDMLSPLIKKGMAISPIIDLLASSNHFEKKETKLYLWLLLKSLKRKLISKFNEHTFEFKKSDVQKCKTFRDFDNLYTAPINGFKNAEDYYKKSSSINVLNKIKIPTLIVSALDDPFLTDVDYPREICKKHPFLHLETPLHGGHVGFINEKKEYWLEARALKFLFTDIKI